MKMKEIGRTVYLSFVLLLVLVYFISLILLTSEKQIVVISLMSILAVMIPTYYRYRDIGCNKVVSFVITLFSWSVVVLLIGVLWPSNKEDRK